MANLRDLHEDLVRIVLVGRDLSEVLTDITSVARRGMPGAEAVSVTLIRGDEPYTAAHDGQMALDADELQYERGYGPCMEAGRSGQVFLVDDMATDDRWPDYARHAAEHGVGSSLSVPLPFQATRIGGLNTYSSRPHAFGRQDVEAGEEVAFWVAYAIGTASAAAVATDEAAQMRSAMLYRSIIEQAKGILMERYKIAADPAFNLLSRSSQQTGIKLREVADALVRTGTLPGSR